MELKIKTLFDNSIVVCDGEVHIICHPRTVHKGQVCEYTCWCWSAMKEQLERWEPIEEGEGR